MNAEELLSRLGAQFAGIEKTSVAVKDYPTVRLSDPSALGAVFSWLKKQGFEYLDMITAVDYKGPVSPKGYVMDPNPNAFLPEGATPQVEAPTATPGFPYREAIELVYCASHLKGKLKLFLKVELPRQNPSAPSLAGLFKTADWQEREVFDLLGVRFEGHPNLTKILTPDFIQGHPLRKDYEHVPDRFDR